MPIDEAHSRSIALSTAVSSGQSPFAENQFSSFVLATTSYWAVGKFDCFWTVELSNVLALFCASRGGCQPNSHKTRKFPPFVLSLIWVVF